MTAQGTRLHWVDLIDGAANTWQVHADLSFTPVRLAHGAAWGDPAIRPIHVFATDGQGRLHSIMWTTRRSSQAGVTVRDAVLGSGFGTIRALAAQSWPGAPRRVVVVTAAGELQSYPLVGTTEAPALGTPVTLVTGLTGASALSVATALTPRRMWWSWRWVPG